MSCRYKCIFEPIVGLEFVLKATSGENWLLGCRRILSSPLLLSLSLGVGIIWSEIWDYKNKIKYISIKVFQNKLCQILGFRFGFEIASKYHKLMSCNTST